MNLGIIARSDKTGLGNQTRNLVKMLQPFRVMLINSTLFNKNQQYPQIYSGYNVQAVNGFPTDNEVRMFLRGLDAVLTCETFYSLRFIQIANSMGVRTYNQYNYEFLDNLNNPRLELPTKLLSPSLWHFKDVQAMFPGKVGYLPPPTFASQYTAIKELNMQRTGKRRFVHTVGRMAINDRNGTLDLIKALEYTDSEFELVIKMQTGSTLEVNDSRVTIDTSQPINEEDLYKDFDALILPRRYAGLCLPMNEALMSGLPTIMTDVEPNNLVLPKKWLVESEQVGEFMTRTMLPIYSAKHKELAKKLDWLCQVDLAREKHEAFTLGFGNYSADVLRDKYREIIV